MFDVSACYIFIMGSWDTAVVNARTGKNVQPWVFVYIIYFNNQLWAVFRQILAVLM